MLIRSWSWRALVVAAIAACGSRPQPAEPAASAPAPAQPTHHAGGGAACPMMPPAGAQITTADTSDGVAIVLTTTGDVAELRARARHMADMHNRMAGMHGGEMGKGGGMHSGGMHEGGKGMPMVPSRASVEEVPGGARIVLVPADPSRLAALREHVRMHAGMMQQGRCPMMAAPSPAPGAEHEPHHPGGA